MSVAIPSALASEACAIVSVVDPDANAAGTLAGDVIDMSKFDRIMAICMAGTLGTSATLDFKLQSSNASGGTYADITGKAITQLTQAGTDSDKQAVINLRADELPEGDRYVRVQHVTAVATSDSAAIVLGFSPAYAPASDNDLASVDEIKS
jgi:hypothetical protein